MTRRRLLRWLSYSGLALGAVLVIVLSAENRALRRELTDLRRQEWFPRVGDVLPSSKMETLDGDSVMLGGVHPGGRQVLFVFNTRCGWCRRSLPAWRTIAERLVAASSEIQVLGISLDSEVDTRAYAVDNHLSFPIVVFQDERLERLYHLGGVPITLVVDHTGEVVFSRLGSLEGGQWADSVIAAAEGR